MKEEVIQLLLEYTNVLQNLAAQTSHYFTSDCISQDFGEGSAGFSPVAIVRWQLGLLSSEGSVGLDMQDGSLTWLALTAGRQLSSGQKCPDVASPAQMSWGNWTSSTVPGLQGAVPRDQVEIAGLFFIFYLFFPIAGITGTPEHFVKTLLLT